MKAYIPSVSSSVMNIVDNMKAQVPELKDIDPWRIDMANRGWATSEDFPKYEALMHWLPPNTIENKLKYMEIKLSDQQRVIYELESYNITLQKTINEQKEKIERLS